MKDCRLPLPTCWANRHMGGEWCRDREDCREVLEDKAGEALRKVIIQVVTQEQ